MALKAFWTRAKAGRAKVGDILTRSLSAYHRGLWGISFTARTRPTLSCCEMLLVIAGDPTISPNWRLATAFAN